MHWLYLELYMAGVPPLSVSSLLKHEMKKLKALFLLFVRGLVFLLQRHDSRDDLFSFPWSSVSR